ncbi:MAG: putative hydrocarbon binding protein [Colwellia sp.]|jgi:predicted hydrocarbon binding protein
MQGTVFTSFSDMVIEKMGMPVWNELLKKIKPNSEGIYTNGMQYENAEIMAYATELSIITQVDAPTLIRKFGEYLFIDFYRNSPLKTSQIDNLKDFLICVDSLIHKEVKRLYPNAYLPSFNYDEKPNGDLIMFYQSKRKLCHLCEGLIMGAAKHFQQSISIKHPECMHHGAERCKLVICFEDLHER